MLSWQGYFSSTWTIVNIINSHVKFTENIWPRIMCKKCFISLHIVNVIVNKEKKVCGWNHWF